MIGQNKFFHPSPASPPVSLGGGLEAWRGFYSSVRPSWRQLTVNVNVCTAAFYTPGNLAERMIEFMNIASSSRIASFVRGVRVKTAHLGYKKTVKTVAKVTARQHKFTAEGLSELPGITCAVWLEAAKQSVELSTYVIPGVGPAAKAAKTLVKTAKAADKLGGKDWWTNFIKDTCQIDNWDFDIGMAFDIFHAGDESQLQRI